MPIPAFRVATFGTTIFTEINTLAQQYGALNLGQGKPDFDTPPDIVEQLVQALRSGQYNQYAPGPGTPSLRKAVADHAARFYNLEIDAANGVVVTAGATEGILSAILGLVDPGDEVIVIEPFYDSYVPNILMAGAVPVYVPLHPPDWAFDPDLVAGVGRAHQFVTFAVHHPTQEAVAYALDLPDAYYEGFRSMYETKRQLMMSALDGCGLKYQVPEGTYFIMADYSDVFDGTPMEFTRHLIKEIGVACVPPETLYGREHAHIGRGYVRFAFCKGDDVLRQVKERLARLRKI